MVPNLVRKRGFLYIRSQIPKKIKRRERRRKVDQKRVCTEVRQKKKKKRIKIVWIKGRIRERSLTEQNVGSKGSSGAGLP